MQRLIAPENLSRLPKLSNIDLENIPLDISIDQESISQNIMF